MASQLATLRKGLSAPGLIRIVREQFSKITDTRRQGSILFTLPDTLCAALAMFQFKWPSLLQFDEASHGDRTIIGNLRRLYWLNNVASDSQMRKILDPVKPSELRKAFRAVHSSAQLGKVLEDFAIFDNRHLLSIDGTGLHSSTKVRCPQCGVKKHRNGEIEYYHQSLAAVIVHPDQKTVLPLDFEPIVKSDGDTKNDCERNAAKRLLRAINQLYSNRPFTVLEDALAANGPHIQTLFGYDMDFIINIKPVGNASLFEEMHKRFVLGEVTENEARLADGSGRGYRFAADLPLNASHPNTRVNMIEYWEVDKVDPEKVTLNMSWITNMEITRENVFDIVRAARTRWKVENETFNTLKNQGYNYEHNYGHGKQNLSSTLAGLMLLSFLIDQLQQHACQLYKTVRKTLRVQKVMWESMRSVLRLIDIPDWETLWRLLGKPRSEKAMLGFIDTG
jgi:hypothetical protein